MESASNNSQNEDSQKIWKKNAPYLYDVLITWGLDWPSLCVEWLPKVDYVPKRNFYLQHLILGTNTSGAEPNFLLICKTRLPISKIVLEEHNNDSALQKDDIDFLNKMTNEQMIEEYSKTDKKI
jgi:histone-binding protein RBBP4